MRRVWLPLLLGRLQNTEENSRDAGAGDYAIHVYNLTLQPPILCRSARQPRTLCRAAAAASLFDSPQCAQRCACACVQQASIVVPLTQEARRGDGDRGHKSWRSQGREGRNFALTPRPLMLINGLKMIDELMFDFSLWMTVNIVYSLFHLAPS